MKTRLLALSCLTVRPHAATRLSLDTFSLNLKCEYFSKIYQENSTLANGHLDAQNFINIFITILCMFWAISCSSSGAQIVLIQHLVLSLSVSDRPVHRLRKNSSFSTCAPDGHLLRVTIPDAVLTLNPLTWRIWWAPNNASRWQIGFNSAFEGLIQFDLLRMSKILLETCRGL
jgi:hypothetical protein